MKSTFTEGKKPSCRRKREHKDVFQCNQLNLYFCSFTVMFGLWHTCWCVPTGWFRLCVRIGFILVNDWIIVVIIINFACGDRKAEGQVWVIPHNQCQLRVMFQTWLTGITGDKLPIARHGIANRRNQPTADAQKHGGCPTKWFNLKNNPKRPQLCEVYMYLHLSALDDRKTINQKHLTSLLMSLKVF